MIDSYRPIHICNGNLGREGIFRKVFIIYHESAIWLETTGPYDMCGYGWGINDDGELLLRGLHHQQKE